MIIHVSLVIVWAVGAIATGLGYSYWQGREGYAYRWASETLIVATFWFFLGPMWGTLAPIRRGAQGGVQEAQRQ